ncbi:hypothetical protein SpCBS45565_g07310 [Spizellomyces sp. 'palustris']|nr:hypothetical protein SpCBS45565_g07310 [Spizellomyces sp. 'palustris']
MSFQDLSFQEVLDDLQSRFIINIPEEELASVERICFQIEQAHWFYEDFVREENPRLPSFSLKNFCAQFFRHCPLLHRWAHDHETAFQNFMEYKVRVPVCGAIILNERLDKVLLVKGWKSSSGWGFPKGKINKDEPEAPCAIREVKEETGFDITPYLRVNEYVERTIKGQRIRLYILTGVPEATTFIPQTRKEIGDIRWHKLNDLPGWNKDENVPVSKGDRRQKYYMVTAFVSGLRQWMSKYRKAKRQGKARNGRHLSIVMGYNTATDSEGEGATSDAGIRSGTESGVDSRAPIASVVGSYQLLRRKDARQGAATPVADAQVAAQSIKALIGVGGSLNIPAVGVQVDMHSHVSKEMPPVVFGVSVRSTAVNEPVEQPAPPFHAHTQQYQSAQLPHPSSATLTISTPYSAAGAPPLPMGIAPNLGMVFGQPPASGTPQSIRQEARVPIPTPTHHDLSQHHPYPPNQILLPRGRHEIASTAPMPMTAAVSGRQTHKQSLLDILTKGSAACPEATIPVPINHPPPPTMPFRGAEPTVMLSGPTVEPLNYHSEPPQEAFSGPPSRASVTSNADRGPAKQRMLLDILMGENRGSVTEQGPSNPTLPVANAGQAESHLKMMLGIGGGVVGSNQPISGADSASRWPPNTPGAPNFNAPALATSDRYQTEVYSSRPEIPSSDNPENHLKALLGLGGSVLSQPQHDPSNESHDGPSTTVSDTTAPPPPHNNTPRSPYYRFSLADFRRIQSDGGVPREAQSPSMMRATSGPVNGPGINGDGFISITGQVMEKEAVCTPLMCRIDDNLTEKGPMRWFTQESKSSAYDGDAQSLAAAFKVPLPKKEAKDDQRSKGTCPGGGAEEFPTTQFAPTVQESVDEFDDNCLEFALNDDLLDLLDNPNTGPSLSAPSLSHKPLVPTQTSLPSHHLTPASSSPPTNQQQSPSHIQSTPSSRPLQQRRPLGRRDATAFLPVPTHSNHLPIESDVVPNSGALSSDRTRSFTHGRQLELSAPSSAEQAADESSNTCRLKKTVQAQKSAQLTASFRHTTQSQEPAIRSPKPLTKPIFDLKFTRKSAISTISTSSVSPPRTTPDCDLLVTTHPSAYRHARAERLPSHTPPPLPGQFGDEVYVHMVGAQSIQERVPNPDISTKPRLPGPAGKLPTLTNAEKALIFGSKSASILLKHVKRSRPISDVGDASNGKRLLAVPRTSLSQQDEDFTSLAWSNMLNTIRDYNASLNGISAFLRTSYEHKIPDLIALIKELRKTDVDGAAIFKDPTGEMQGAIHRNVFDHFGDAICNGTVLELRKISTFKPTGRAKYLNVTLANIVSIFTPTGRPPRLMKDTNMPDIAGTPLSDSHHLQVTELKYNHDVDNMQALLESLPDEPYDVDFDS